MYLTGKAYLMVIIIFHFTLLFYFPYLTKYFVDHLAHHVPELTYIRSLIHICRPILLSCVLRLCFKAQLYKESYHQCQKMSWKLSSSLEPSRRLHINSVPSAIDSPWPWGPHPGKILEPTGHWTPAKSRFFQFLGQHKCDRIEDVMMCPMAVLVGIECGQWCTLLCGHLLPPTAEHTASTRGLKELWDEFTLQEPKKLCSSPSGGWGHRSTSPSHISIFP